MYAICAFLLASALTVILLVQLERGWLRCISTTQSHNTGMKQVHILGSSNKTVVVRRRGSKKFNYRIKPFSYLLLVRLLSYWWIFYPVSLSSDRKAALYTNIIQNLLLSLFSCCLQPIALPLKSRQRTSNFQYDGSPWVMI